ncbi:MAG TPA: hypothetical protein VIG46_12325 [Candidatus Baltobacteraceae bacterium]
MERAFPRALDRDACAARATFLERVTTTAADRNIHVLVEGEDVDIPYRIYTARDYGLWTASPRQRSMVAALLTRHANGYVREANLRLILSLPEPWIAPFVVQLTGEYVWHILALIWESVDALDRSVYAAFLRANPAYYERTRQRVISYWDCYYRPGTHYGGTRDEYVGFKLLAYFDELIATA